MNGQEQISHREIKATENPLPESQCTGIPVQPGLSSLVSTILAWIDRWGWGIDDFPGLGYLIGSNPIL
jgi:hypothetical protein